MNAWSNMAYLEYEFPVSYFSIIHISTLCYRNVKRNLKKYFIKFSKKIRLSINMKTELWKTAWCSLKLSDGDREALLSKLLTAQV